MEAKELRIGNWIEKEGKIYQATALTIFCCGKLHKPIPITEEWLKKFGFNYPSKEWASIGMFGIRVPLFDYFVYGHPKVLDGQTFPLECRYIHQLQNLYYSVTGEELQTQAGGGLKTYR